jgi:TPR repeat protein
MLNSIGDFAMVVVEDPHGEGVAKDEQQAVKYYQMAADQGHARAQCNLGVCYANGKGVAKDEQQAVKYYQTHQ